MVINELKAIQKEHGYLPLDELKALSERIQVPLYELHGVASFYPHFHETPPPAVSIKVCRDISCHLKGACETHAALLNSSCSFKDCKVEKVSCLGRCDEPVAVSVNDSIVAGVGPKDVERICNSLMLGETPRQELKGDGRSFKIDPYQESQALVGRELFQNHSPEEIIASVRESGLRGMGGAGFPTGMKWGLVREAQGDQKYVICNADESEPGTFKDRFLLQHFPHLMIEGMAIAAWCVGATKGTIFIRHEYYREREKVERALAHAQEKGVLGDNFLGSSSAFELDIFESPGGYICGEETALLEALEGKRAEPRNKPPFPGTHGLHGKPTLINNVETFAYIPSILQKGAEWFKGCGTNGSSGLKFMSISGHINSPGVYEVPLGTTAEELIRKFGGGMLDDRPLKAFLPGGASTRFLPASMAGVKLDYKSLTDSGSALGTGAFIAIAEGTDMLELAHNLTDFFKAESCGKCVPCRVGSEKLVTILDGRIRGKKQEDDTVNIHDISSAMIDASICGLGQAAPNPILSVLEHFKDEIL